MNGNFKDIRLIEAFDYIDPKYIAEVGESLKLRSVADKPSTTYTKPSPFKYWKQYAALVACVLLLSLATPLFGYIAEVINSFAAAGTAEETTEPEIEPYDEYVLTEEDLEMMNAAYRNMVGGLPDDYTFFKSVESAMRMEKGQHFYFGKYGETIVIWSAAQFDGTCCFELGGHSFEFYTGTMFFFNDGVLYLQTEIVEADIMTADEIDGFYDRYTDFYLPMARDPYVCLVFTPGLELLTEDEMRNINMSYDRMKYDYWYIPTLEKYKNSMLSDAEKHADTYARMIVGYDPHRFFNEKNKIEFRYYGKIGEKCVLWGTDDSSVSKKVEIAGYEFIFPTYAEHFILYENGEFTDLAKAYEFGIITDDDVALIYERHLAYEAYLAEAEEDKSVLDELIIHTPTHKPSPIILPEDEIRKIVWDYIQYINVEEPLMHSWSVRCYAAYYSTYAVMIDGGFFYAQAVRSESVAGYTFTFPNSHRMYIYKDGAFYRLEEAYSLGIVDEKFIGSISWDNKTKS